MEIDHKNLVGRRILSQYGLLCDVLESEEVNDRVMIKCRALYNNKIWQWDLKDVHWITRNEEVLDLQDNEVFGKVNNDSWDLYPKDQCRKLTEEEVFSDLNAPLV